MFLETGQDKRGKIIGPDAEGKSPAGKKMQGRERRMDMYNDRGKTG